MYTHVFLISQFYENVNKVRYLFLLHKTLSLSLKSIDYRSVFDLIPIIITMLIFVPITNQPAHNRLAENQPPASLHYLNEYGNVDEKWEWFRNRILTLDYFEA